MNLVVKKLPKAISYFLGLEIRNRTLFHSIFLTIKKGKLASAYNASYFDLLKRQSKKNAQKTFIVYENQNITYKKALEQTNCYIQFLADKGYKKGDGIGIMMGNNPEFIFLVCASQALGLCIVPLNTGLMGNSLIHIINDSGIKGIIIDEPFVESILYHQHDINIKQLIINSPLKDISTFTSTKIEIDSLHSVLHYSYNPTIKQKSLNKDSKAFIIYTSGTTGLPKGVVYSYENKMIKGVSFAANILYKKNDVLYCYLPLFHGNALFQTFISSLVLGITMVLTKKFSASRFWQEVKLHEVTSFNAIGSIIPILYKQPPQQDKDHKVRIVISSACPANLWKAFEERYGVTIYEAYGAVDAPGYSIANLGDGPVGSFGRPTPLIKAKVCDHDGKELKAHEIGELVFKLKKKDLVKFYNNAEASAQKNRNGYLYTGDLVYKDEKGYYYFVGRKTESMRVKGENVSAYEVEQVINKHPKVLDCTAFAVPSDLAEDEIMTCIVLMENEFLDASELKKWLGDKLAKFAIPRYYRFINELPKTSTFRVIKTDLVKAGITSDTIDTSKSIRV